MFQPKLTVVTIVYNNVRDIERTVLSVLNQTYSNIEICLCLIDFNYREHFEVKILSLNKKNIYM